MYSVSAQNRHCSTSPCSFSGYRNFPKGSTIVKSIVNQMITVLVNRPANLDGGKPDTKINGQSMTE